MRIKTDDAHEGGMAMAFYGRFFSASHIVIREMPPISDDPIKPVPDEEGIYPAEGVCQ